MPDHRLQHVLVSLMVLAFLAVIVGAVGEILGWWNDVGVVLMLSGASTASFLAIWSWVTRKKASNSG